VSAVAKPELHDGGRGLVHLDHTDLHLTADASRVVLRPFSISGSGASAQGAMTRTQRVVKAVLAMSEAQAQAELDEVDRDFHGRHWQTHGIFLDRFHQVRGIIEGLDDTPDVYAKLIGAYFSHEYSYAAAAIMNPSIVEHPDQTGVRDGALRFVMSLRTVGEGHISSVTFREGLAHPNGQINLWPQAPFAIAATAGEHDGDSGPVHLRRHESAALSGTVLFPTTRQQRNGIEDMRLVRFTEDDGHVLYVGTYTAYSGHSTGCEMMETERFVDFDLIPLRGAASAHKGLALFPHRIDGRYAAIGRLDHESLYFMQSDDRHAWNYGKRIMGPKYPWELIQMGNCGSPILIDDGWLLLTHGVGAMRQYSLGAALLDRNDPSKVLARTPEPFLTPIGETREGYVPNVVYTCGALLVGERLFVPYGVADSAVRCVSLKTGDLVAAMV
jgi:predicted GH43/DUF377 family glycosyl hydrolase